MMNTRTIFSPHLTGRKRPWPENCTRKSVRNWWVWPKNAFFVEKPQFPLRISIGQVWNSFPAWSTKLGAAETANLVNTSLIIYFSCEATWIRRFTTRTKFPNWNMWTKNDSQHCWKVYKLISTLKMVWSSFLIFQVMFKRRKMPSIGLHRGFYLLPEVSCWKHGGPTWTARKLLIKRFSNCKLCVWW